MFAPNSLLKALDPGTRPESREIRYLFRRTACQEFISSSLNSVTFGGFSVDFFPTGEGGLKNYISLLSGIYPTKKFYKSFTSSHSVDNFSSGVKGRFVSPGLFLKMHLNNPPLFL